MAEADRREIAPERIWLHGIGDPHGETVWADDPNPSGEPEELEAAVEYIRADRLALTPPCPNVERDERLREALEKIGKFVDDFKAPWGSWKTAWWEFEVSDDAAFTDDNALMHVANMARLALSEPQPTPESGGKS